MATAAKEGKKKAKPQLFKTSVLMILSDGERDISMGEALIEWKAMPEAAPPL